MKLYIDYEIQTEVRDQFIFRKECQSYSWDPFLFAGNIYQKLQVTAEQKILQTVTSIRPFASATFS